MTEIDLVYRVISTARADAEKEGGVRSKVVVVR
jgi:hypothetical protein